MIWFRRKKKLSFEQNFELVELVRRAGSQKNIDIPAVKKYLLKIEQLEEQRYDTSHYRSVVEIYRGLLKREESK